LKKLTIYNKKDSKIISDNYYETDLAELKSYGEYNVGSHQEFLKIPSTIIGSKTILEWLFVDNISFWWFIAPAINQNFNESAFFIDQLASYVSKNKINSIELKTNFDKLPLIQNYCHVNDLNLQISKKEYYSFKIENFFKNKIKKFVYGRINKKKLKKRIKILENKNRNPKLEKNSIILTSQGVYRRELVDEKIKKITKKEFFIHPFFDVFHANKIPFYCVDLDYTFYGSIQNLIERLNEHETWIPFEYFLYSKNLKTSETLTMLKKSIRQFVNSKDISNTFHGVSLLDYLGNSLEEIFYDPHLPTYVNLLYNLDDFFRINTPKAIIQVYEHGPLAKSFEIAAKRNMIPTFAIQHGLFTETTHDYMHKETHNENNEFGNILPDLTCVYGKFFKDILIKNGSYPENKISVIGNPNFYNLDEKKLVLDNLNIRNKYNFETNNIVLIPLSNFQLSNSEDNFDYLLLKFLYENLKNLKNVSILIRSHPASPISVNTLNQLFPKNKFNLSKYSLLEDLFASDLVVTTMSTVGLDATIMEKPTIFVNTTQDQNLLGEFQKHMIESGVALVSNKANLISYINNYFKGGWKIDSSKQKDFLEYFFNSNKEIDLIKLISNHIK
jgi:hypothetical protein